MIGGVSQATSNFYLPKTNNLQIQKQQQQILEQKQKDLEKNAQQISTGKRINSAADSAASLAILQKLTAQQRGYSQGSDNVKQMQSALNVAEGALGSMADTNIRMRELTIQAGNGTLAAEDRKYIQDEISQLQGFMNQTANFTEFNTKPLLDGSFTNQNVASNPSGNGMSVSIGSASLQNLGLDKIDLTSGSASSINDTLTALDGAGSKITSMRSEIGAMTNRLDNQYAVNQEATINLTASASKIGDTDISQAIMQQTQNLSQWQAAAYMMQTNYANYGSNSMILNMFS